jgi:hypothetical protein
MNENKLQSPHHSTARKILRVGGPVMALVGLILMIVGVGSLFASFASLGGVPLIGATHLLRGGGLIGMLE